MPDYEAMYLSLFKSVTNAIHLLEAALVRAAFLDDDIYSFFMEQAEQKQKEEDQPHDMLPPDRTMKKHCGIWG